MNQSILMGLAFVLALNISAAPRPTFMLDEHGDKITIADYVDASLYGGLVDDLDADGYDLRNVGAIAAEALEVSVISRPPLSDAASHWWTFADCYGVNASGAAGFVAHTDVTRGIPGGDQVSTHTATEGYVSTEYSESKHSGAYLLARLDSSQYLHNFSVELSGIDEASVVPSLNFRQGSRSQFDTGEPVFGSPAIPLAGDRMRLKINLSAPMDVVAGDRIDIWDSRLDVPTWNHSFVVDVASDVNYFFVDRWHCAVAGSSVIFLNPDWGSRIRHTSAGVTNSLEILAISSNAQLLDGADLSNLLYYSESTGIWLCLHNYRRAAYFKIFASKNDDN